jgi:acyl carrier protein
MSTDIAARLVSLLAQRLDLPEDELALERSLRKDLDLDSMTLLEILMEVEERFGIEIDQREADRFQTIGDLARFLEQNA